MVVVGVGPCVVAAVTQDQILVTSSRAIFCFDWVKDAIKNYASAGNWTLINCLERTEADQHTHLHNTTILQPVVRSVGDSNLWPLDLFGTLYGLLG